MLPFLAHILPLGCPRRRPPLRHQARPSGRSLREKLETVDSLKARGGIHLVSLEERLYTFSTAGELVFYLLGAIAHFKRRLISERTCDGIAAARRPGRTPGRPPFDQETILATQVATQKLIEAGFRCKVATGNTVPTARAGGTQHGDIVAGRQWVMARSSVRGSVAGHFALLSAA